MDNAKLAIGFGQLLRWELSEDLVQWMVERRGQKTIRLKIRLSIMLPMATLEDLPPDGLKINSEIGSSEKTPRT